MPSTPSLVTVALLILAASSCSAGDGKTGGEGASTGGGGTGSGATGSGVGGGGLSNTGASTGSGAGTGSGATGGTPADWEWALDASTPPDTSTPDWEAVNNPRGPTDFWGTMPVPRPTGTWWNGFVLEDGGYIVHPLPYHVRAGDNMLELSVPNIVTNDSNVSANDEHWARLGATEGGLSRAVTDYDDLSVSMTWTGGGGSMTAPVVSGMAYVTMLYEGLTPDLGLADLNGTGTRFEVSVGAHDYVVFTSTDVTFSSGVAQAPLSGWVRMARLTDGAGAALDAHASAIPLRGSIRFGMAGDDGIIELSFDTDGAGEPLMWALPHHQQRMHVATPQLDSATEQPLSLRVLKGEAQAYLGNVWEIHYPLTDVSFRAPRPIDPAMESEVRQALQDEAGHDPGVDGGSAYWAGKNLGSLARLALIADELDETSMRDTFVDRLKSKLELWLNHEGNDDMLVYDESWGGAINECVFGQTQCDYGNGVYSDHHFHYGYFVHAAAVIALFDPSWVADYGQKVGWLIRDYANPYRGDPAFPRFRHFDFYSGHSWTSGLFNHHPGRNQESTSEAVNAYYGLQLWGEATGDDDLANVGKILRLAESAGAQTYWHITPEIYDEPFSDRPCVGINWSAQADYGTWFGMGQADSHVCGIQMIPVTPAFEDLFRPEWVATNWDTKLEPIANALGSGSSWRPLYAATLASHDPDAACDMLRNHDDFGSDTKANMLHYCATRP